MDLNQASPKFQSKHSPSPSSPLDASPSAARVRASGVGSGDTVGPTGPAWHLERTLTPATQGWTLTAV